MQRIDLIDRTATNRPNATAIPVPENPIGYREPVARAEAEEGT
jgi:hypothetical protein